MKKSFFTLVFLLFFLSSNAQIIFEPGYFIDNEGENKNCLIKNIDWKNNPTEFVYRTSETSEIKTHSIQNVKEFSVIGESKFVRFLVNINSSSDKPKTLEGNRLIESEEETLFLKVLSKGDASLYYYEKGDLRRFFYSVGSIKAEQLLYKRFYYSDERINAIKQSNNLSKVTSNTIGENNTFRQQLWNNLTCKGISRNSINKISYKEGSLLRLFEKYNKCVNPNWTVTTRKGKKTELNISLRPGLSFSSLNFKNNRGDTNFESQINIRFGAEFEFVLPFNKNKWSLVLEPTYRNYQSTAPNNISFVTEPEDLDVDYRSIEFSAGFRYSAFLNTDSKIFISGYMLNDSALNSSVSNPFFISSRLEVKAFSNFAVGMGYKLKNKISLEFRYDFDRGIVRTISGSEFKNISLILGYTIL